MFMLTYMTFLISAIICDVKYCIHYMHYYKAIVQLVLLLVSYWCEYNTKIGSYP